MSKCLGAILVNNFFLQTIQKDWKWVGGSSVQLEINKKIGKHIFKHYLITFLGEHSNVNNVINALLCFVLASMYRYSWLITLEIFRNFVWDRGVGGWGVSYPNFF